MCDCYSSLQNEIMYHLEICTQMVGLWGNQMNGGHKITVASLEKEVMESGTQSSSTSDPGGGYTNLS